MKYKTQRESGKLDMVTYHGYIDEEYAGYVVGMARGTRRLEIIKSSLIPKFRGTKAVRAFKEIINAALKDYPVVSSSIDNQDNGEIRMVLSAGFNIIGTKSYKNEISVEILKTREDIDG